MIHYSVSNIFHHSLSFVARKTCLHLVRNALYSINFQQYAFINTLVPEVLLVDNCITETVQEKTYRNIYSSS